MQPDSLVFVAILAAWAAYLLPRWVTRRDALGQNRGRDRHSVHLRVLPRRRRPRAGASSAPLLRSSRAGGRSLRVTGNHGPAPVSSPASAPLSGPAPAADAGGPIPISAGAGRRAAVRRGRLLAMLLMLAALSWAATLLPGVPAWAGLPATGLVLLDLVALVSAGRRRAAARRVLAHQVAARVAIAERRVIGGNGVPSVVHPGRPAVSRAPASRGTDTRAAVSRPASRRTDRRGDRRVDWRADGRTERRVGERRVLARRESDRAAGTPSRRPGLTDPTGPTRPVTASVPAPATGSAQETWTPVAVPPPTYTLKPVVPRGEPRPLDVPAAFGAVTAPGTGAGLRPWDVEHTWADDLDDVLARRRAVNS